MAAKEGFVDAKELAAAHKALSHTEASHKSSGAAKEGEEESSILSRLEELYERKGGDVQAIFDALDESPRKALKHPPRDAKEFAQKYCEGYYHDVIPPSERKGK